MFDDSDSDDIIDMFLSGKELKKDFSVAKPQSHCEIIKEEEEIIDFKRESKGTGYSDEHREREERRLFDQWLNVPSKYLAKSSHEAEDTDNEDENSEILPKIKIEKKDTDLDVYSRYEFNITPQSLPILEKKDEILRNIEHNPVLVLTASTGTGKTSQVPQYILEEARKQNKWCNIVVTQPRRIAASSVAKRVALERKCELGTLVGYQVGLDRNMDEKKNSDTRILYTTTGVLLQKLINEKTLKRYTHIILDEVHERDIDIDMLLIVVRLLLKPSVTVILMSATLEEQKFSNYFKKFNHFGEYVSASFLDLNVPRNFETKLTYLDDLEQIGATGDILNMEKPGISEPMYKLAMKVIELVLQKSKRQFGVQIEPSFLVFLPGIQEINRMHQVLYEENQNFDASEFSIVKLHSSLSREESERAFDTNISNKIILATNIAESSVTLPGVRFVIDFCLTKYLEVDTSTNITQLKLDWASKMSMTQREGRVGRLGVGQVIRLIYKDQYDGLPTETTPEIKRSSLESVVLKSKQLEMGKPSAILALALDPPEEKPVEDSILLLKELGALTKSFEGELFDPTDGDLTFMGSVMARLPVDVRISKLIMLGFMFSCLEECIIIGAGFSSKSIFKMNFMSNEQKMESYHQKLEQAAGSGSDAIAILNVYKKWRKLVDESNLSGKRERDWCDIQMISLKNLRDLHDLVIDIKSRMKIFAIDVKDDFQMSEEEKLFKIKLCIAGAFYPNFFEFGGSPPGREERIELNDSNPCATVYFNGMPQNRIGQIYEKQIREKLVEANVCDELNEMKVSFDSNSARIQVQFKPLMTEGVKMVPGEVEYEVYKAVKLSKMDRELEIQIMSRNNEDRFASDMNIGTWELGKFVFHKRILQASKLCVYPKISQKNSITGKITHINDCGKFFFQPERATRRLEKMMDIIKGSSRNISSIQEALEGNLIIIKHNEILKRAKIIQMPDEEDDDPCFIAFLVDYGNNVEAKMNDFYISSESTNDGNSVLQHIFEMPPQCFQCCLSEIIPSALKCLSGWTSASTKEFKKFVNHRPVDIFVNSFVDRIASVNLVRHNERMSESLNNHLIIEGYAQRSDDSYIRLLDQLRRHTETRNDFDKFQSLENELVDVEFPAPEDDLLETTVQLNGPYSPLVCRLEGLCRKDPDLTSSNASVEPSSVNHILIDPYPNDANKKILVAASMSNKNQSNRVTLHQTSIMPHVPGMPCLLGLIFGPVVQVRASKGKSRHTSILTGLGCNLGRKPHFGEHDCMFFLDVEFDKEDFELINELRHQMSVVMQTIDEGFHKLRFGEQKKYARVRIRELVKKIFDKERKPLGENTENSEWNWKVTKNPDFGVEATYPAIYAESLVPLSENTRRDLKHHANELKRKADINSKNESIKCQLCEEKLESIDDLRLHVLKKIHKERCLQIRDESFAQ